jgi:hypothetical protein
VRRELLNKRVKLGTLLASQSDVINKDRHKNLNVILGIDIEAMI